MKSEINFPVLANWVSMLRAEIDGAIWLSDDDIDGRFYEKCAHSSSRVVPSPGVARQLLSHVRKRGIEGLVATMSVPIKVDDNYSEGIFWPGLGDVASLLLASDCCERTLEEITGTTWFKSAEKEVGSLRDRAISVAWTFQQILIFSSIEPGLFAIEDFIDWNDINLSIPAINANFGADVVAFIATLQPRVSGMSREEKLMKCDGVNALRVLARATKMFHPRGLIANQVVDTDHILGMLRVAYDFTELERDPMYWQMRRWERHNPKFPLLRLWRLLDPLQVVQDQRYWENDLKLMIQMDSASEGLSAFKVDLDNFKAVNEQLGHTSGDEAIRMYCKIVQDILKQTAEVYRRGGDEVVALAPGLRQPTVVALAEKIRSNIEAEFLKWGNERGLSKCPTASIGVVDIEPGCLFESVIQLMDQAQSDAKAGGKNRVILKYCKANCMP
jgi:diguanylate cyclase (GGDEF)-like protein